VVIPPDLDATLPERAASEQEWMSAILLVVPRVLRVRLFRQVPGGRRVAGGGWMKGAPVGAADLTGWCRGSGRRVELEAKYGNGRTTPDQERWLATASDEGVVALLARYEPAETLRANLGRIVDALRAQIGGAS
jgi:hypothetical protein